jgi:PTH1 family peptidyl-tRNA hydrolase
VSSGRKAAFLYEPDGVYVGLTEEARARDRQDKVDCGSGQCRVQICTNSAQCGFLVCRQVVSSTARILAESRFQGEVGKLMLGGADCWLLKPSTYMNHSGRSVSALANYYRITQDNILVVHDELDLSAGTVRLKKAGGHGGHNGLRDIIAALGGNRFWRLRVGVGHPGHRDQVVDYVLDRPSRADFQAIDEALADAVGEAAAICAGEQQVVMNRLHVNRA